MISPRSTVKLKIDGVKYRAVVMVTLTVEEIVP